MWVPTLVSYTKHVTQPNSVPFPSSQSLELNGPLNVKVVPSRFSNEPRTLVSSLIAVSSNIIHDKVVRMMRMAIDPHVAFSQTLKTAAPKNIIRIVAIVVAHDRFCIICVSGSSYIGGMMRDDHDLSLLSPLLCSDLLDLILQPVKGSIESLGMLGHIILNDAFQIGSSVPLDVFCLVVSNLGPQSTAQNADTSAVRFQIIPIAL
jgi:hypothetical protein